MLKCLPSVCLGCQTVWSDWMLMSFITIVTLIFPTLSLTSGLVQILKGMVHPKMKNRLLALMLFQHVWLSYFCATQNIFWRMKVSGVQNIYICIYAFSRRFYPKRLAVHSGYTFFISMCVPWELNPRPFALLTQCSTTEPQENNIIYTRLLAKFTYTQIISYWWLNLIENLFVNNCQSDYSSVQIKFWLDWKGCRLGLLR